MKDPKMVRIDIEIPEETFDNIMLFRKQMVKTNDDPAFRYFNYIVGHLIERGLGMSFSPIPKPVEKPLEKKDLEVNDVSQRSVSSPKQDLSPNEAGI